MLFKMLLDTKCPEEKKMVRGFIRHGVAGFAAGFVIGCVLYTLILMGMAGSSIEIPVLFAIAMLFQAGALGAFVGLGVYMSRVAERDDDDEDDDDQGGGTRSPVIEPRTETAGPVIAPGLAPA